MAGGRRRNDDRRRLGCDVGQVAVAQIGVTAAENHRKLLLIAKAGGLIAALAMLPAALREKLGAAVFLDAPRREAIFKVVRTRRRRRLQLRLEEN